jgi:hypothetical protein
LKIVRCRKSFAARYQGRTQALKFNARVLPKLSRARFFEQDTFSSDAHTFKRFPVNIRNIRAGWVN